jgi:glycosyltransferase involved in cell wall biosynthesis
VYEPSPITVGLPARVMRAVKGARMLFWVQDLWPESLSATGAVRSRIVLKAVEHFVRFIYRGCDRILIQSQAFAEPIRALGVADARILFFPNSAEAIYQPRNGQDAPAPEPALPAGFRVMFAGNIGAAQDFATILAAAEQLKAVPEIQWIVLGDGRMAPWVAEQVRERGLESCVHLLGQHPVESMPQYFSAADAMLVTLRKEPIFALTIPAKVQSYLACGRPLIAALEGEGARVVRSAGAGLVAEPEDATALAEAVMTMYRMPVAEREAMGERGRRYFEANFDRDMLLRRLDGWIKELQSDLKPCES